MPATTGTGRSGRDVDAVPMKKKGTKQPAPAGTKKAAAPAAAAGPRADSKPLRAETGTQAATQNLGELISASPWANRLRTGAASAAAAGTRAVHGRRAVADKAEVPAGFTDLMAASPWATKVTPAFKRRSPPDSTSVSGVAAQAATPRPVTVKSAARDADLPRGTDSPRAVGAVPMAAQAASISPPPLRRSPAAEASPRLAAESATANIPKPEAPRPEAPRPERPLFAPRTAPVSRPAREVQRDELGEAIRELAGAVAESQFVGNKPGASGVADADRLKMRLAERQRAVSRAGEEPAPRFRPKQRAAIPKRPVVTGTVDVAGQPCAAAVEARPAPRAAVTERPAPASSSSLAGERQKKKLEKTIPIEGLGRGVFNALGNGVGRIVNVGRQSVSGIALGAKDGARLVSGFFKEKKPTRTE
jgi:hypothetical protein